MLFPLLTNQPPLISVSSHRSHSSTLITSSFQSDKNKFKLISSHFSWFFPKWAGRLINHCSRNFTQSLLFCISGIILRWSQTHTSSFFRWSSLNQCHCCDYFVIIIHVADGCVHTSHLSFALHRQDFQIPNFTPKNN